MLTYPVTQTILYTVPQVSLNTEILIPGTLSTFNRTLVILVNTIWGKQLQTRNFMNLKSDAERRKMLT